MRDVKCRLDRLAVERDGLTERLAAAQASRAAAEAEQEELRSTLERERAAALAGLGTAQARKGLWQERRWQRHCPFLHLQPTCFVLSFYIAIHVCHPAPLQTAATDAEARAVAAEAALALLSARHREEQAVVEALRRQIVFFTHGEGDGWGSPEGASAAPGSPPSPLRVAGDPRPELRYAETLAAVEELLGREAHVAGERYSLAKVLHTVRKKKSDVNVIYLSTR